MNILPYRLIFLFFTLIISACESNIQPKHLTGVWKVDSAYTYYNGFDFMETKPGSDWATYVYDEEGLVKEIKYGSFMSYFYSIRPKDTLILRSTRGGDEVVFQILKLNRDQMVLKKTREPIFQGGNQTRYEIRYFSRTEMPKEENIPFDDPRKSN